LTVIILRTLALREKNVLPLTIESEMERLAPGANPERLFRIVQHDASSLARIVRVALAHLRWPRSENVETVQTRARYEMVRLEKGLVVLEVIIGIAPLIGLIGTVSGLVHVFASLGVSASSADPKLIARGISEALNCTVFGLGIAVPSLIAFVYFLRRLDHVQEGTASSADQFTGIKDGDDRAGRARARDRDCRSKRRNQIGWENRGGGRTGRRGEKFIGNAPEYARPSSRQESVVR